MKCLTLSSLTAIIVASMIGAPNSAYGFEGATTHAGMTGNAALASQLHRSLTQAGHPLGLFELLKLDPSKAPRLSGYLHRLDPDGGFRPDEKFQQTALAWLIAGSALADIPDGARLNHYYTPQKGRDPRTKDRKTKGLANTSTFTKFEGIPALEWLQSKNNLQSLGRFYETWRKATQLADMPQARQHNRAMALLALGGILHLLQDMAVPSHTRNDYAVGHFEKLGSSTFDRGSSFERLTGMLFGRLGIPSYKGPAIRFTRAADFFSNKHHTGLADLTSRGTFSPGTLPRSVRLLSGVDLNKLRQTLTRSLPLPLPGLPLVDIVRAQKSVCYVKGPNHLLSAYSLDANDNLRFFLDRKVQISVSRHVVPLAVGYSTAFIDFILSRLPENGKNTAPGH
jgi:hypothetical protein